MVSDFAARAQERYSSAIIVEIDRDSCKASAALVASALSEHMGMTRVYLGTGADALGHALVAFGDQPQVVPSSEALEIVRAAALDGALSIVTADAMAEGAEGSVLIAETREDLLSWNFVALLASSECSLVELGGSFALVPWCSCATAAPAHTVYLGEDALLVSELPLEGPWRSHALVPVSACASSREGWVFSGLAAKDAGVYLPWAPGMPLSPYQELRADYLYLGASRQGREQVKERSR